MTPQLLAHLEKTLDKAKVSNHEYSFDCPFCAESGDSSATPKLGVNGRSLKVHCFKCDYSAMHVSKLLKDLNGGKLSIEDQVALLGTPTLDGTPLQLVRNELRGDKPEKPKKLKREHPPEGTSWANPQSEKMERYIIEGRGYTEKEYFKLCDHFHLTLCHSGRYKNYITFPVFLEGDTKPVWFTNRYADKHSKSLKSLNPERREGYYQKHDCLLGHRQAYGKKAVAIVEGPFSAAAFVVDVPDAGVVCLMGSSISPQQIDLLKELVAGGTEEFVVATDPDKPTFGHRLYDTVSIIVDNVSIINFPVGMDADDCRRQGLLPKLWLARKPRITPKDAVMAIFSAK